MSTQPSNPSDEQGPEGRRRLLDAAMAVVREHGGPALRMTDIAERAGVSFGLIAHHFGSREGLVDAAQRALLAGEFSADLADVTAAVSSATDTASLLEMTDRISRGLLSAQRADARIGRAAAIGIAQGRPEARELLVQVTTELLTSLTTIIADAQARGFARDDLEPRAIATFVQAYALGLVLADLDAERSSDDALAAVIGTAVRALLAPIAESD